MVGTFSFVLQQPRVRLGLGVRSGAALERVSFALQTGPCQSSSKAGGSEATRAGSPIPYFCLRGRAPLPISSFINLSEMLVLSRVFCFLFSKLKNIVLLAVLQTRNVRAQEVIGLAKVSQLMSR